MSSPLRLPTPPRWLPTALADFDAVLRDHAHCEKKAAASAMSLVAAYPDDDELIRRCTRLAQEELRHFQQVHELLVARGVSLGGDGGDPYAQGLRRAIRSGGLERRVDRLLVSALIEARSAERLELLATGLADPALREFYARLAQSEAGHFTLFVDLAEATAAHEVVERRLSELAEVEAEVMSAQPIVARIH